MVNYQVQTIKEIVTQNFKTAAVFEKYSLDFCCKGGVTIAEACTEKQLNPDIVLAELQQLPDAAEHLFPRFNEWDVEFLTTYIVQNHHAYVRRSIPALLAHTQKIASVHGERHPELLQVASLYGAVANEMMSHMHKEEMILFPYIIALHRSSQDKAPVPSAPFGSAKNPIAMMMQEHESAGSLMYKIRELTDNYTIPGDACTTYRVALQELNEFERDLHQHVHLENNILFPKAIALEEKLHNQFQN